MGGSQAAGRALAGFALVLAAACGVEIVGQSAPPESDGGAPPAIVPPLEPRDGSPEPADGGAEADADAEASPSYCDPTDPSLVLCLPLEGEIADRSSRQQPFMVSGDDTLEWVDGRDGGKAVSPRAAFSASMAAPGASWTFSALTVEAWVKVAVTADDRQGVLEKDDLVGMFVTNQNELRCIVGGPLVGGVVPQGVWTHLACVAGDGQLRAYVNGALVGSAARDAITAPGDGALLIGADAPAGNFRFQGAIDAVRVYSRAKDDAEIAAAAVP